MRVTTETEMETQPEPRIRMQIETQLERDRSGSLKSSIGTAIAEQAAAIEAELKQGARPEEYRRLTALKKGLDAASLILERTWSYYHP